jgi:hypothetical protein
MGWVGLEVEGGWCLLMSFWNSSSREGSGRRDKSRGELGLEEGE